jgi:Protein of unknown function (DUF3309)
MPMLYILVIVLLVVLVLGLPNGPVPQWHALGYYPSGLATVLIVVLIILLVMGRL